jgi:hypothetical protein
MTPRFLVERRWAALAFLAFAFAVLFGSCRTVAPGPDLERCRDSCLVYPGSHPLIDDGKCGCVLAPAGPSEPAPQASGNAP